MPHSAIHDPSPRARAGALTIAVAGALIVLAHGRPAAAQTCNVPPLSDEICAGASGTIESYKRCYADLFDTQVIPAFTAIAQCSHAKAEKGIREGLESVAALITGQIKRSLDTIQLVLNADGGAPQRCIADLNFAEGLLRQYIDGERNAPDLDAYRKATYTFGHLSFFTDILLSARQNRAACDGPLQLIKQHLTMLSELRVRHPDYCEILRDSASYEHVSKIEGLAQYTSIDPAIEFDALWNIQVTWNSQCGYFDFANSGAGQATVRHTQCATGTVEYQQTLVDLGGVAGWLSDNRVAISVAGGAAIGTIAAAAGAGSLAGPIGVAGVLVVGLIISGIDWWIVHSELDELEDMIAEREQRLQDAVDANLMSQAEFDDLITARCTPFQPVVEQRVQDMLRNFDIPKHLGVINSYFTLSDGLHDWYNELFLWATTPGPDGERFIDRVSEQDLIAQRNAFDTAIFDARATQEVAAQRAALNNIKGTVTLLGCSNLSPSQKNAVRAQLRAGLRNFNRTCSNTMAAMAVQPDQPVAFVDGSVASSVVCAYHGFRNNVASLEIRNGDGFASNMTLRNAAGAVLAQLANVTSDTDFTQAGFPGFACLSEDLQSFGTSEQSRLAEATYPLRIQDNIFGFDDADAAALRPAIQSMDSLMRLKETVCTRQLGTPVDVPRTGDACGIPVPF